MTGRRKKQVPGWAAREMGAAPSLALQCWQLFSSCLIPPRRESRKERRGGAEGPHW